MTMPYFQICPAHTSYALLLEKTVVLVLVMRTVPAYCFCTMPARQRLFQVVCGCGRIMRRDPALDSPQMLSNVQLHVGTQLGPWLCAAEKAHCCAKQRHVSDPIVPVASPQAAAAVPAPVLKMYLGWLQAEEYGGMSDARAQTCTS